jgi:Arc/MetJ-type ribon-helix-helix transcriptional regulator
MQKGKNEVIIAVRIPRALRQLMEQFIERDAHMGLSELVRDSIREKIRREAPDLYLKLFSEAK